MDTKADLKLMGVAYVDGQELLCPCGNGFSLEIHKHGFREVWPAWICCLSCGKGEDSSVVTNGLVDAVLASQAARIKDEDDRDVFRAEWRGIVMTGETQPRIDIRQLIEAAKVVHEAAAPEVKRWWRSKKKAAKAQVKEKASAVTGAAKGKAKEAADAATEKASEAISTAKATALTTAWTLQTGGAGPTGSAKPKRQRCTVKGCRGGMVTISTRVHASTGKTSEVKIPCGVCHRSST